MLNSSIKRNMPPWLDQPLMKLMKARQKAWKRFRMTSSQSAFNRYKEIRNLVSTEKKRKKQLYEEARQQIPGQHASGFESEYQTTEFPMEPGPQYSPIQDIWGGDGYPGHSSQPHGWFEERGRFSQDPYHHRGYESMESRPVAPPMFPTNNTSSFPPNFRSMGTPSNRPQYNPILNPPPAKPFVESSDVGSSPSRVLFVRNLPVDIEETEVANLASPFGIIANMVLTKRSGLAFIEMRDQTAAEQMVEYYDKVYHPFIRGKGPIAVSFSRHNSLILNTSPPVVEVLAKANKQYSLFGSSTGLRTVVRVQVYQAPIGLHLGYMPFYRLFSPFGRILRIAAFKAGALPCCLVEFESPISAHVAILQSDGTTVRMHDSPGAPPCLIRSDFSHQTTVDVRTEDVNNRDFTRNPMPVRIEPGSSKQSQNGTTSSGAPPMKPSSKISGDILDLFTEERLSTLEPNVLSELAKRMVKPLLKAALTVGGQQSSFIKSQAEVLEHVAPLISTAKTELSTQPAPVSAAASEDSARIDQSSVVTVSNLNEERINPDNLFILFGVYGDVLRVKIPSNKKDTALVQFEDGNQAQTAVNFLDKVPLYGKQLRCSLLKNDPVFGKAPFESNAENVDQFDRDYTNHRLHRFRHSSSHYMPNLCSPSRMLQISNLPEQVTEDDITDVFMREAGLQVEAVKLIKYPTLTALVQLQDVERAVTGLIVLHDYELEENFHMQVSFSKSTI